MSSARSDAATIGGASEFEDSWLRNFEWETNGRQIRYKTSENKIQYAHISEMMLFLSVDPAISESKQSARSATPVVGLNEDGIFLLDDSAERGLGVFELAHKVVDLYLRYKPRKIFIETVVYQRAFSQVLAQTARDRNVPHLLGAIEEIRSHGKQSKDLRIYSLEPFFKRGNFYTNKRNSNFLEEYLSFPRGDLRDILGAREDIQIVGDRFVFQSEVFFATGSDEVSQAFGTIKARLERAGQRIEDFDVAVAAHAVEHGGEVYSNDSDFGRFEGVFLDEGTVLQERHAVLRPRRMRVRREQVGQHPLHAPSLLSEGHYDANPHEGGYCGPGAASALSRSSLSITP